ncbi:conserved protein of unknown function [Shewanella benthica]|uniref:Uncharacterized protein n=1 Tax=Shewanella benthica TaxID=43661 RepID=A0A330LY24_9GAMM|nr:conserved protein of unknown function [Shewanella benthica]
MFDIYLIASNSLLSRVEFIAFWHESHQAYIQQYDDTDMPDLYALKEE